jgi:hypothetical protein
MSLNTVGRKINLIPLMKLIHGKPIGAALVHRMIEMCLRETVLKTVVKIRNAQILDTRSPGY